MTKPTCSVDGCIKPTLARTWCGTHYRRWQRNGSIQTTRFTTKLCTVDKCGRTARKRGWCSGHYRRWAKTGDLQPHVPLRRIKAPIVDGKKHCAKCDEWFDQSHQECPPCRALRQRQWATDNPTYWIEWQRANRDKLAIVAHNRRAQKLDRYYEDVDRSVVFARDNYTCQLCLEPIDMALRFPHLGSPSLDHIIPLNKGGHHLYSNVQSAHFGCNSAKGDRILNGQGA